MLGNLTIDEAVWVEQYGTTDTKENRKNLPQGFFWDCCGLQLNSEGCITTEHAPLAVLKRNGRVLEKLETDNERTTARNAREIYDRDLPGPPPSKKRKVGAGADTKCRGCGELYDKSKNTKRVCHWHDLDGAFLLHHPDLNANIYHYKLFGDSRAHENIGTAIKMGTSVIARMMTRTTMKMTAKQFSGPVVEVTRRQEVAS